MKARLLIGVLALAAFLAGFISGWHRLVQLIGCPPDESDRLQAEIEQVQTDIHKANQKIFEIQKRQR